MSTKFAHRPHHFIDAPVHRRTSSSTHQFIDTPVPQPVRTSFMQHSSSPWAEAWFSDMA